MTEAKQALALVGDIYDGSLDPTLWPDVLHKTCDFVGGSMANLFSQDSVNKKANLYYSWGDDPRYTSLYLEKHSQLNPLYPTTSFFPAGDVFSMTDIISHAEMRKTRFYKEWLKPQGYVDVVACNVEKTTTSSAPLTIVRHERDGLVDEAARRRVGLIAPHLRRAVLIGKVIEVNKVEAAALAESLDRLAAALFLVDPGGRVVHANVAGHAMLAAGAVLRAAGGRMLANDPQADQALQDSFAAAAAGDATVGTKGIAVALKSASGERFLAHVLPLTSGSRRVAGDHYRVAAAMFVHKPALDVPSPLAGLVELYGLSPREISVLLAIVEAGGVPAVAAMLGLTQATVKTYLKSIFQKTGAKRQADLVKLVAGLANPFATPRPR
jgi:DNA-binding CsgD family transcriptional regulator